MNFNNIPNFQELYWIETPNLRAAQPNKKDKGVTVEELIHYTKKEGLGKLWFWLTLGFSGKGWLNDENSGL